MWDPLRIFVFLQPLMLATLHLVHRLGLGLTYQKRRLGPKLAGSALGKHPKKIWDPLLISATVEASNFKINLVYNLGLGLAYQKTTFRTKIGGGLGQGSIRNNLGPAIYFCNR